MRTGAFLPSGYGQDRDFRVKRVREFRVVTNGIADNATLDKLNKNMETKPKLVFYTNKENAPLRPQGAHSTEHLKIYEYEPVFVARETARRQQQFPGAGVPRDQSNQMTLIPMLSTLNGARGESIADLQRQFMPIGISEATGRDTNSTGLTNIVGGIITIDNATPGATLLTGDYAVAIPPTREEARKLEASIGNLANKNGRVPMVLKKLDPELIDFGRDGTVRRILAERILEVAPGGQLRFRTGNIKVNPQDTLADNDIAVTFKRMVETVIDSFVFARIAHGGAQDLVLDTHRAALFLVMSGQPPIGTNHFDEFIDRIALGPGARQADKADLKAELIRLARIDDIAKICKNNPIQKNIQDLMVQKRDLEDSVLGLIVIGAGPGKNGDLHLRAYAH